MTKGNLPILSGVCPNPGCQKKLFFPEHGISIECSGCGQRHDQTSLLNVEKHSPDLIDLLESLFQLKKSFEKEDNKVHGLSNYQCTILSQLMTFYGMDKKSGKATLLTDMGKNSVFDCGQLSDRAFLIDPAHLDVTGYGRDRTGSDLYLEDTLNLIKSYNDGEERLIPIHADGDGHCLVHALSRALVGWELFWHPLRVNLKEHFLMHLEKYKMLFQDFIEDNEWLNIIRECDPEFVPTGSEPTGLRNIHIFGLANVLRRPIILLDSIAGIKSSGDYSAIFLPIFSSPSACKNKEGVLNKPLCIAWSSQGRNHFIPLVGVKGRKCPLLSRHLIQRAWGVSDIEIDRYVDFQNGTCQIGGEKTLQIGYIQRLINAMGQVFFTQHNVAASVVADMYLHIYKPNGLVFGVNMDMMLEKSKQSVCNNQLFVCLSCHHLTLLEAIDEAWLVPGGKLYDIAIYTHKTLKDGYTYTFPVHDVVATYDASLDKLTPEKRIRKPSTCPYCSDVTFRQVKADHSIAYENGDRTLTKCGGTQSGYKLFWNGKEYSTIPKSLKVVMEWKGTVVAETVPWFQEEEDLSLNSNVYEVAQDLVQSKFPGEFGSERLVQKVVDQILYQTTDPVRNEALPAFQHGSGDGASLTRSLFDRLTASRPGGVGGGCIPPESPEDIPDGAWSADHASKAIMKGFQTQSIHKEELTKSKTEMEIKQRIEDSAAKQQSRRTDSKSKSLNKKRSESGSGPASHKAEATKSKSTLPTSISAPSIATTLAQLPGHKGQGMVTSMSDDLSTAQTSSKRIRIIVTDKRSLTLELPSECTFLQFRDVILKHTNELPQRYRILHGFPPQELKPPASLQEDYVIPVQSGERVLLEAKHDVPAPEMLDVHACAPNRDGQTVNSFGAGKDNEIRDALFQELVKFPVHTGGKNVDDTIRILKYTVALSNKDLWTYTQKLPHLFSVKGIFYQQVAGDVGLEHGRHYTITSFEHKLFAYNKHDDRLELCLEPYGHFAIQNNVERDAHVLTPSSQCSMKTGQRPFSGQGHSLRSSAGPDIRMPTDIPMSPKRTEARTLNMFCDPSSHEASIEEEDEEVLEQEVDNGISDALLPPFSHQLRPHELTRTLPVAGSLGGLKQAGTGPGPGKLVRKGPGYSELSPIPENLSIEKSEGLHDLVSRIEQAVETMGKEADKISQTMPAGLTSPRTPNPSSAATIPPGGTNSSDSDQGQADRSYIQGSRSAMWFHNSPSFSQNTSQSPSSVSPVTSPLHQSRQSIQPDPPPNQTSVDREHVGSGGTGDSARSGCEVEAMVTNSVAAYAEKVASDIAAMDTESKEDEGCIEAKDNSQAKVQRMESDDGVAAEEVDDEPFCDEVKGSDTPMVTESKD